MDQLDRMRLLWILYLFRLLQFFAFFPKLHYNFSHFLYQMCDFQLLPHQKLYELWWLPQWDMLQLVLALTILHMFPILQIRHVLDRLLRSNRQSPYKPASLLYHTIDQTQVQVHTLEWFHKKLYPELGQDIWNVIDSECIHFHLRVGAVEHSEILDFEFLRSVCKFMLARWRS